jgi:hypothetical protein
MVIKTIRREQMSYVKKKFLGYFEDETEAGKAYNEAVLKYHGKFGVYNSELY